jgi:THO complex subunit 1
MSDLSFRRHTLVQALIILDFLLTLTRSGKEKLATVQTSNRAMMNSIELKEDDVSGWRYQYLRVGTNHWFFRRNG